MSNKNIWYLPGPMHQYAEDIKALAREYGLRIIDANVTESREDAADEVPEVTIRSELLAAAVVSADSEQSNELAEQLRIERDLLVTLIESAEGLRPLEHPEVGELPIRLFDALTKIHAGITDLAESRDELARKRDILLAEVDALKKAAEQPVKDKAKPEAADKK